MSTFTDDELMSLKRNVSTADRSKNTGGWFVSLAEWDALLARLEAAEKVIGLVEDCTEECSEAIKAWYATRKASGR